MTDGSTVELAELALAAGLRLIVAAGSGRPAVRDVYLVGDPAVDRTNRPVGALAVLDWRPSRRGAALPALEPLLQDIVTRWSPAAVAVVCRDRHVIAPPAAVELADRRGIGLLWGTADSRADDVVRRTSVLLAAARSPGPGPAPGLAAGSTPGLVGGGLDRIVGPGADLAGLVARTAQVLGAEVVLRDTHGVLAEQPTDAATARPVVADVALHHAGAGVGTLSVTRDRPLDTDEQALLDAVAVVLALAVRVREVDDARHQPARALLAAVLGEDLAAREAALRRSRRLQVFPPRRSVVVVVEPFAAPLAPAGLDRLAHHLELPLQAEDERATMVVHEGAVVLLVGADVGLEQLVRALRRRAALPLTVGTSRVVDDIRRVPGAYREAQRAAAIGRRLGSANQVSSYDQLGVVRVLYQLPEHERRAYAREVLGPVAGGDPEAADLRRVLRALRTTHGNITESARRLFIHPNTLRQRITRLEALIGPFLADADRRLTVFVALELHRLDDDTE